MKSYIDDINEGELPRSLSGIGDLGAGEGPRSGSASSMRQAPIATAAKKDVTQMWVLARHDEVMRQVATVAADTSRDIEERKRAAERLQQAADSAARAAAKAQQEAAAIAAVSASDQEKADAAARAARAAARAQAEAQTATTAIDTVKGAIVEAETPFWMKPNFMLYAAAGAVALVGGGLWLWRMRSRPAGKTTPAASKVTPTSPAKLTVVPTAKVAGLGRISEPKKKTKKSKKSAR